MKNIFRIVCALVILGTLVLHAQQNPSAKSNPDVDSSKSLDRIAIATVGEGINSKISKFSGRAPYYLLFDGNGVFIKSIKNPAQSQGHRASSGVVNLLTKESVKIVIAGEFGDKMENQLKANKIEYYEHEGIAKDVIQTFVKSKRSKNAQK